MTQKDKVICIFGGSGFVGQHVCQDLARAGYRIKIATRIPESAYALKTYGNVGQIAAVQCDYKDKASIEAAVDGCYGVINLVGALFQKRKNTFKRIHQEVPNIIAQACKDKQVTKLIHVSALGIQKSKSKYAKSKLAGEKAVLEAYPEATILRPSVVFGPGDGFFNMFAKLATFLPALPLIGGGNTKFQPVYVGDIAQAVDNIMAEKTDMYEKHIYQLAGPEIVTFKEIYKILLTQINRECTLIPVPWTIAKIQGAVLSFMPKPLLTCDQVKSLQTDSVMDEGALGLKDLNVETTAMSIVLPRYLSNFKKGGPFVNKKEAG